MSFLHEMLGLADHTNERQDREADLFDVVRSTLNGVHADWQEMSGILRGLLGAEARVDEMALLFAGEAQLATFVRYAVRCQGYELFNTAWDHVQTGPISSNYDVTYWFLATPNYEPGVKGYRLELMSLLSAGSPLHDRLTTMVAGDSLQYRSVHASFRCDGEEDYATAVVALAKARYELVQRCSSGYGTFSYWKYFAEAGTPSWYLKPRVNRRDEVQA